MLRHKNTVQHRVRYSRRTVTELQRRDKSLCYEPGCPWFTLTKTFLLQRRDVTMLQTSKTSVFFMYSIQKSLVIGIMKDKCMSFLRIRYFCENATAGTFLV